MLVLTETDIRRLISTGDALAAASDALKRDSLDEFVIPSRLTVGPDALLVAMAAHCSLPGLVVKVLSTQVSAKTPGLSSISGSVVWFESEGGRAVAVMDGSAITSIRTGAASGVATAMALREARVLAMIGAGAKRPTKSAVFVRCGPSPRYGFLICTVRHVNDWQRNWSLNSRWSSSSPPTPPKLLYGAPT